MRVESLRWLNTVFARALANAIQRTQGLQKTNMASIQQSFYLLNASAICAIFLIIEHSVLMVLVFNEKCIFKKVAMQRTLQFADFSLLLTEPS